MDKTQFEKAIELITEASKNLADLNDVLKSPKQSDLSEEEKKSLQLALLKLAVVVKEFGK